MILDEMRISEKLGMRMVILRRSANTVIILDRSHAYIDIRRMDLKIGVPYLQVRMLNNLRDVDVTHWVASNDLTMLPYYRHGLS